MGYSRDAHGRLTCDVCGNAGARKRPCPSGYCQAWAMCPTCNTQVRASGDWAKAHADCKRLHEEYQAEQAARAAEPDHYVRTAWGDWADDVPTGMVKLLTHADGILYMSVEDYRAVQAKGGRLPDSIVGFARPADPEQPTTKQVFA